MNTFAPFTKQSPADALHALASSTQGLASADAAARLRAQGPNTLSGGGTTWVHILRRQFTSSFVYLMIAAAAIALVLGEFVEMGMVLLFVAINAGLGFFQEYHSEQTIRLLRKYLVAFATVLRDAVDVQVESTELVTGDVIRLKSGDVVPADARVLTANGFRVDESVLTGESVPVSKTIEAGAGTDSLFAARNIVFSGTHVVGGEATAVVVATGYRTAFGQIASRALETPRESTFEKGINRFSAFILRLVLGTLVFVLVANYFIKSGQVDVAALLLFSIALAVSVVPEALPTVTTFSLSRGALRLARSKVVVKRLTAIEDLGSIEVLCSDKTGTITENRLSVADVRGSRDAVLRAMCLAAGEGNARDHEMHDPFDLALLSAMSEAAHAQVHGTKRLGEIPFDPTRRRNSVLIENHGREELIVRGAPEAVFAGCRLSEQERAALDVWLEAEGKHGRRVLAVASKHAPLTRGYAQKEESHGLTFLGCVSFVDPVKQTAHAAVKKAERLGVTLKILTGDSREVAGAVAAEVGIIDDPARVITGDEFEALSSVQQHEAVISFDVFARVSPEQKFKIIQLLQETREVGFLGEGINDAPALRIANVGLVVAGAADVAREAADIVLLQRSLHVIVDGIQEGRHVFANTIKYIKATLTSNFGNFYALALSTLFIPYLPMLPLQILLVNLLSDFPMIAIATDRVDREELRSPRQYEVAHVALFATILGVVSTFFDFLFFALYMNAAPSVLQTNWFIGSILTELALIFSLRTHRPFFRSTAPSLVLTGLSGCAAITTVVIPYLPFAQRIFGFTAPNPWHLATILGIVLVYFFVSEFTKLAFYRFTLKKSA